MFAKRLMAIFLFLIFIASFWSCKSPASPDLENLEELELGEIYVWSTPVFADIYLDGAYTGKRTNSTIKNVKAGVHTIKLRKEGFKDWEQSVIVIAGLAPDDVTWVGAILDFHSITVTSPTWDTIWIKGQEAEIRWEVDDSQILSSQARTLTDNAKILYITELNIELYKADILMLTIALETENDGSYTWTVDPNLEDGSDYKVRVGVTLSCYYPPEWRMVTIYGESDEFTMMNSP